MWQRREPGYLILSNFAHIASLLEHVVYKAYTRIFRFEDCVIMERTVTILSDSWTDRDECHSGTPLREPPLRQQIDG